MRMYMVRLPAQPMETLSLATTTSISIGTAPYNYKTTLSLWAALPPYGYISLLHLLCKMLRPSFVTDAVQGRSRPSSWDCFRFGQGTPLPNLGFFLRPARVTVKTTNQEKEPTLRPPRDLQRPLRHLFPLIE